MFIGSGRFDAGALRFDNNTALPIQLDSVTVDVGGLRLDSWHKFEPLRVPPRSIFILTQTMEFDFDTSDQPISCVQSGAVPIVQWVIGGKRYIAPDTDRILNTGGIDAGSCGSPNESHPWQRIGSV
jgi:hypothetical protein